MLVNVLWTGGFDSSFRMIQLSKQNVRIQPYYLSDNRLSEENELKAIRDITLDILKNKDTKCEILPLKIYPVSELKENEEITSAYNRLHQQVGIGSQFEWLPRFAEQYLIDGLELSIEKSDTALVRILFNQQGVDMKLHNDNGIQYYQVTGVDRSSDVFKVFGRYHFPVWEMTKLDMLAEYKSLGFESTVKKTWFCHKPIRNKPCGYCNPCNTTISSGMAFRLPKVSRLRSLYRPIYIRKNSLRASISKLIKGL